MMSQIITRPSAAIPASPRKAKLLPNVSLAYPASTVLSDAPMPVAVILLLLSLIAQVMIGAAQQAILAWFPRLAPLADDMALSRLIPAGVLFASLYLLFLSLTPAAYRGSRYPKWPGAVFVTGWWVTVTVSLPWALRSLLHYDATYGSLAGIMITLFFFWLVGLGMVFGAELNAALAETPEERDMIGQDDNRAREGGQRPVVATPGRRNEGGD